MPHYPIEALGPTDAQLVQLDRQRDQSSPCEHRSYSSAFSTNIPGSMRARCMATKRVQGEEERGRARRQSLRRWRRQQGEKATA
ncbi:hypothetical protein PTTG_26332 [Puccinia triticina 1-1 BBBD Race 1]|uniref:Uncharacterized protein n=2 Tax=Puccinia triticina TaxID=208348 RepID=A0A180GW87_PUCT1|nr:uncharacterized protein PtA15_3A750 [Puccinia triticina]OAV96542.1 hypothetical protein PTTG_26332 [Puccinia triticina 1-1 BBBD Race 1]WAQ83380.1 hypothetical protein PtA15_3A750 [Puccinia triticina]